jgi:hypothetical protein
LAHMDRRPRQQKAGLKRSKKGVGVFSCAGILPVLKGHCASNAAVG